jgi:hypothetical protein
VPPRLILFNALMLACIALSIGAIDVLARQQAALETSVRRYAQAIADQDLDAALQEIAPDQRDRWRDFVQNQLGNIYEVRGVAVRTPALYKRAGLTPFEVSVVIDVDRGFPGEFYQASRSVPLERLNGRLYLQRPLLATE